MFRTAWICWKHKVLNVEQNAQACECGDRNADEACILYRAMDDLPAGLEYSAQDATGNGAEEGIHAKNTNNAINHGWILFVDLA